VKGRGDRRGGEGKVGREGEERKGEGNDE